MNGLQAIPAAERARIDMTEAMIRDPCRRNIPAASYIAPMATVAAANSPAAMKAKVTSAMVRMIALNRPSS